MAAVRTCPTAGTDQDAQGSLGLTPPETVTALRQHRQEQASRGPFWQAHDYVFTDDEGKPFDQTRIMRAFHRACDAAGIPRRSVKELRHTYATLALRAGVHPKIVQEAMGHTSIAITLDTYSHLAPVLQGDAMRHLDRLFG